MLFNVMRHSVPCRNLLTRSTECFELHIFKSNIKAEDVFRCQKKNTQVSLPSFSHIISEISPKQIDIQPKKVYRFTYFFYYIIHFITFSFFFFFQIFYKISLVYVLLGRKTGRQVFFRRGQFSALPYSCYLHCMSFNPFHIFKSC